jgi:hypothetical protein
MLESARTLNSRPKAKSYRRRRLRPKSFAHTSTSAPDTLDSRPLIKDVLEMCQLIFKDEPKPLHPADAVNILRELSVKERNVLTRLLSSLKQIPRR